MKFAVVEYTSKSGDVWRHTPERPNYLADPKKEIDTTSFGCYVSALEGEHIPLSGLITGPTTKVSSPTCTYRKIVKRLTGSWPSYSLDYLAQFDVLMVVHQLSDAHEVTAAIERLRSYAHPPIIIGVPTQPYGLLRQAIAEKPAVEEELRQFIQACDIFVSVVRETVGWYEDLSQTPVTYLPQPYPAAFVSQNLLPLEKKHQEILVAGITQRDNIVQGHEIAVALQQRFPSYRIRVPRVDSYEYDFSRLEGADYEVLPFEEWHEHVQTLAKTALVINTDYTLTRGRVQTDCAAVGTPSLGGNSDGTRDLFPDLRSEPATETGKLIDIGTRLLSDHTYYQRITTHASEQLAKYDYAESGDRLRLLVKQFQSNN